MSNPVETMPEKKIITKKDAKLLPFNQCLYIYFKTSLVNDNVSEQY